MILQDYLDEKIAIKCSSEVEINSMLYIIKQMDDEKFIENFKEARKNAESNGSAKLSLSFLGKIIEIIILLTFTLGTIRLLI